MSDAQEHANSARRSPRWGLLAACIVPAPVCALFGALHLREWWLVGCLADPDTIAAYRFGAEAMVATGGSHYASADAYATSSLQIGCLFLLSTAQFGGAWLLRSARAALLGYAVLVAALVATSPFE